MRQLNSCCHYIRRCLINLHYFRIRNHSILTTSREPTLIGRISHVFKMRSYEEMVKIDAGSVITPMQDMLFRG